MIKFKKKMMGEHQPHPGPSRSDHQKMYDAKKQAAEEAHLNTPEGESERQARNKSMMEESMFANGGMACPPDCPKCYSQDMVHAIRKKFFKGGAVDNMEDAFGETYDDMNEEMADGELYDDSQISDQPKDSNEKGDKMKDEDKHGKSMFSKIKQKKAKKSDRGDF